MVTCLLCSLALCCISLRSLAASFLKVKKSLLQVFNLRVEIVAERLSWTWSRGRVSDVHPEMWKSLTSSAGNDLRLDLQMT